MIRKFEVLCYYVTKYENALDKLIARAKASIYEICKVRIKMGVTLLSLAL